MIARDRILSALSDGRLWQVVDLCRVAGCHRTQVSRVVEAGMAAKFSSGLVCSAEAFPAISARRSLAELAALMPGAVLCYEGAVRHWELAEVRRTRVLVPWDATHVSSLPETTVLRTRIPELLKIGVIEEEIAPGLVSRVTSLERTICDLYSSRFDETEIRKNALHRYLDTAGRNQASVDGLMFMARTLGDAIGRPYCRDLAVALTAIRFDQETDRDFRLSGEVSNGFGPR